MASPTPLGKEQRAMCYKAKDLYMQCLEMNSNNMHLCEKNGEEFLKSCPKKWVEYFMKRKNFNEFRKVQDASGYIRKTSS